MLIRKFARIALPVVIAAGVGAACHSKKTDPNNPGNTGMGQGSDKVGSGSGVVTPPDTEGNRSTGGGQE